MKVRLYSHELPSLEWQSEYVRNLQENIQKLEDLPDTTLHEPSVLNQFFAQYAALNSQFLLQGEVSAVAYAYLDFSWKALYILAREEMETPIADSEDPDFPHIDPGLGIKEFPRAIVEFMLLTDQRGMVRELIQYCYNAYREYHHNLLYSSPDDVTWNRNVRLLLPRLLLRNFIPIHDTVLLGDRRIIIPSDRHRGPAISDSGTASRVSRLFRNLFSADEIHSLEQTSQAISEFYVHLNTMSIEGIEKHISTARQEVKEIAESIGLLPAQQRAIALYKHQLALPQYAFQSLMQELREASRAREVI
jgi:hypothetical protein